MDTKTYLWRSAEYKGSEYWHVILEDREGRLITSFPITMKAAYQLRALGCPVKELP